MTTPDSAIRAAMRERYAEAATKAAHGAFQEARAIEVEAGCCGLGGSGEDNGAASHSFGAPLYSGEGDGAPAAALAASLGCRVPTAVADLHPGETVLDLGSGAGADVLISARRVGPTGRVVGLDMTEEMLDLARRNAAEGGVDNVEFVQGFIEQIPLEDESVDVVISDCVINLSADKNWVLCEAARVLRPGGGLAVSDIVADDDIGATTRAETQQSSGCIDAALTRAALASALAAAGFEQIEISETHRVHARAGAVIVRAGRPGANG